MVIHAEHIFKPTRNGHRMRKVLENQAKFIKRSIFRLRWPVKNK